MTTVIVKLVGVLRVRQRTADEAYKLLVQRDSPGDNWRRILVVVVNCPHLNSPIAVREDGGEVVPVCACATDVG